MKAPNKSFEYAPSGPDALTHAAQFKRHITFQMAKSVYV